MRPGGNHDLKLGEPLAFPVYDTFGTLLLQRGSRVSSQLQLDRLLERGFLVDDGLESSRRETAALAAPASDDRSDVFNEIRALGDRLQGLHDQLLSRETRDFASSVMAVAMQVENLTARDTDAALASMQLCTTEDGLGARLVHSAVLCRVFTLALEMAPAERMSTLAAALTYDVALTPVASEMNHQVTPLTAGQRAILDAHPAQACAALEDAGVSDRVWLDAVMQHHERVDGSGYPARLAGDAISVHARVIGIVDTFSAMLRPRAYRDAVQSRQALREIFLQRSASIDERLAQRFVKEIGMYPPGSLVRLANGEVAVVVSRGSQITHPRLRVVLHADGSASLAHPVRDVGQPGQDIIEGVPPTRHIAALRSLGGLWAPR